MLNRVFIIEPHPVHRESYAFLVDRQDDLAVCGVVASFDEAERDLTSAAPDLVVVNLAAHSVDDSLQRIGALHNAHPDLPLLAVSACSSVTCSQAAVDAGASAYLTRSRVPFDLISRIRQTLSTPRRPSSLLSPAA